MARWRSVRQLVGAHGQAVLIDFGSFSIGPREWDLIQTALFADRLGWHIAEEYRAFVESTAMTSLSGTATRCWRTCANRDDGVAFDEGSHRQ
jgi:hypothetical protein